VNHPAIQYFKTDLDNPVVRLSEKMGSGKARLDPREDELGYLPGLLKHFGVNTDTQALVFSRTSFQATKISPTNPRAIYFGDDIALAYVRGSDEIEIAATDSRQGIVFYTANLKTLPRTGFTRGEVCLLKCHQGPATSGVPGIFIGSVFPGPLGTPVRGDSAIITDHRTKFEDRWGGWYINAKSGQPEDRSNRVASNPAAPEQLDDPAGNQNLTTLIGRFKPNGYLTQLSDIVALMTYEHQTQMTNYITRVGWEARIVQHDGKPTGPVAAQLDRDIEALVQYMLFAEEQRLKEPIQGVSTFTTTFPKKGPYDRRGRSLRDFDLKTRLFRYPLSYMVYSPSFDTLPNDVRDRIYRRLFDILSGKDQSEKFAHLTANDRRAILEILRDTKPNLPPYWIGR
jgi:hypothetical protein